MDEHLEDPDDRYPDRARDADLVVAARSGDQQAFGQLYDHWFDRVYGVALGVVRQPDVAVEVTQDAFLAAWRGLAELEQPLAFGGWLLRITRNGALNRREKEQRSSPIDDSGLAVIEATGASPVNAPSGFGAGFGVEDQLARLDDPAQVAEQTELQQLVWSAVGALGERDAEVLDLQLRYGMSPAEIGEIIGVNRNAANQLVHRVRGRLEVAVRARVLWRGDRPACDALADLLAAAGVAAFDADAVKIAERHAPSCGDCSERRHLQLQPSALFAAIPLLAAPIVFKQQVAGAMELAGAPMQGSAFSGASTGVGGAGGAAGGALGSAGSGGGSGADGAGSASAADGEGEPGRNRWSRRAKVTAMVVAAIVVIGGGLAVLAAETDEPSVSDVAVATTVPSTGTLSVSGGSTTTTTTGSSSTTATTTAAPTTTAAAPTTTAAPAPPVGPISGSISLSGSTIPANGGPAPTLTWSVTGPGAYSVAVTGFDIEGSKTVPSAAASGSGPVCPGSLALASNRCVPSARQRSYDYVLTVTAPDGSVIFTRSVTLTVG